MGLASKVCGKPLGDFLERLAALPERTSGSDIRAVLRRAVLVGDGGSVSTATLLTEVASGRYPGRGSGRDVPEESLRSSVLFAAVNLANSVP